MNLIVNSLIKWQHEVAEPCVERLLHVSNTGDIAVIDVNSTTAVPTWRRYEEIAWALDAGVAILLENDDFAPYPLSESELNCGKYDRVRGVRDKAYALISSLIDDENRVLMLFEHERARLINKRTREMGVARQTLYVHMRRWWQGGQTPNTLLGHYYLCGKRKDGTPRVVNKKLGRPSVITKNDENKRPTGVNVDERWKGIIIQGGEKFYENRDKPCWAKAYRSTLRYFCPKDIKMVNGIRMIILPDPTKNEVFTLNQFRYHYFIELNRNLRRALIARHGNRKYNLHHRPFKGNAKAQATGPGALYQIDATLADVYLRSRLNPKKIVGRPVIYAVMDAFSRMIVGVAVRLEGEGWQGIRLALENVTSDKVAFCADYGITITNEMWPKCYLPYHLTSDRGPLEGKNGDNIPKALHIRLSNTAPYRADWKGSIEQFFNLLNIYLIHALPGAVDPYHERGDRDYRLDAVLDIYEFTELVIDAVLFHNLKRRLNDYPLDADMIADELEPYPAELYRWGIENRSGSLIERDAETVRINLLPEGGATVTEWGIKFGPCLYTCDLAEQEGWLAKAREFGRWNVRVAFHPRTTRILHLRLGGGVPSIPCRLIDSNSAYAGCDWGEVNDQVERDKVSRYYADMRKMQDTSDLEITIKHKVTRALKAKGESLTEAKRESKRSRTRFIRENRRKETEAMQQDEVRRLLQGNASGQPLHTSLMAGSTRPEDDDAILVPMPQIINLNDIRKKKMKNG